MPMKIQNKYDANDTNFKCIMQYKMYANYVHKQTNIKTIYMLLLAFITIN